MIDHHILRLLSVLFLGAAGYFLRPFQLDPLAATVVGILFGIAILVAEWRLRRGPPGS